VHLLAKIFAQTKIFAQRISPEVAHFALVTKKKKRVCFIPYHHFMGRLPTIGPRIVVRRENYLNVSSFIM
jgi:hypothetical protein